MCNTPEGAVMSTLERLETKARREAPSASAGDDVPGGRGPLGFVKTVLWALTSTPEDRRRALRL
jgi:hypothetical protein